MWGIDFLLVFELALFCFFAYGFTTQVVIPWRRKLPLFPAFRTPAERLSEEMDSFRHNQLLKEIERANTEKAEAELEVQLLEARRLADEKHQEVLRKQKGDK